MLGKLFGGGAAEVVEAVGKVADHLFTSDEERLTRAEMLERLRQQPHLAQVALNKQEAAHRSVFVAGWRPAIGWTCALALAYHFVLEPMSGWLLATVALDIAPPPVLDTGPLLTIVLGMLGLGGLRTIEKAKRLTR